MIAVRVLLIYFFYFISSNILPVLTVIAVYFISRNVLPVLTVIAAMLTVH